MRSRMRLVVAAVAAPAIIALTALGSGTPSAAGPVINSKVIAAQLNAEHGRGKPIAHLQPVSGGVMDTLYQMAGVYDARAQAATGSASPRTLPTPLTQGCANTYSGGAGVSNVRANQDCGLRRQAEEVDAVNPTDHDNVIAG